MQMEIPLFILVSDKDGDYLPEWLIYEDAGRIISGIARDGNKDATVLIVADDQNGGSAQ